jgi:O-antigen ligase
MAAFIFSKSRLSVIALTVVWIAGALWIGKDHPRVRRKMMACCVVLLLAAGIAHFARATGEAEQTSRFRLAAWNKAVHQIVLSPILGVGMGTFEQLDVHFRTIVPFLITLRKGGKFVANPEELNELDVHGGTHVHNSFLQAWLDFGLIGCLGYLALLRDLLLRIHDVIPFKRQEIQALPAVRFVAAWNAVVAVLTLLYMCVCAISTAYIFIGPIAPMFLMISFGRLVASTEWLRGGFQLTYSNSPARSG